MLDMLQTGAGRRSRISSAGAFSRDRERLARHDHVVCAMSGSDHSLQESAAPALVRSALPASPAALAQASRRRRLAPAQGPAVVSRDRACRSRRPACACAARPPHAARARCPRPADRPAETASGPAALAVARRCARWLLASRGCSGGGASCARRGTRQGGVSGWWRVWRWCVWFGSGRASRPSVGCAWARLPAGRGV